MFKKIISILTFFSLLTVTKVSLADTEYKYINGNIIRWYDRHVNVCIEESAKYIPNIESIVIQAMDTWSSIPSAPKLQLDRDRRNCMIHIKRGYLPKKWSFEPLAINVISAYRIGEIESSNITINKYFDGEFGDATKNKRMYDLLSVLSHEMGHALGLEEEYVDTHSVMYEKFKPGLTIKRDLQPADIRSINGLYSGIRLRGDG